MTVAVREAGTVSVAVINYCQIYPPSVRRRVGMEVLNDGATDDPVAANDDAKEFDITIR